MIIARQAAQMRRLIDDLLDITRIAHHKLIVEKAPLDIIALDSASRRGDHWRVY